MTKPTIEETTAPPRAPMELHEPHDLSTRRHRCEACFKFIEAGESYLKRPDYAKRQTKPRALERYHVRCGEEVLEDEALNGAAHETKPHGVAAVNVIGQTKIQRVSIFETPDAWEINWGPGTGELERHATAVDALEAVRARARSLADSGVSSVLVVEWETTTRAGESVARVLTATR